VSAEFHDISAFDGKLFLAGSLDGKAVVCSRKLAGTNTWTTIPLTQQAARWSTTAFQFVRAADCLFLLADRAPPKKDSPKTAPANWGAWYWLRYYPARSVRGFRFDGPARPLGVLQRAAPGSALPIEGNFIARDAAFGDDVLFTVLAGRTYALPEKGGLFRGKLDDGYAPACGPTVVSERVPNMDHARDVQVANGVCYVLLADNAGGGMQILSSADLREWHTVFAGTGPSDPLCLAVADGACCVGTMAGSVEVLLE